MRATPPPESSSINDPRAARAFVPWEWSRAVESGPGSPGVASATPGSGLRSAHAERADEHGLRRRRTDVHPDLAGRCHPGVSGRVVVRQGTPVELDLHRG